MSFKCLGAGVMAKELKALAALLKDPSSSPSTHMAADTICHSVPRGSDPLL